MIYFSSYRQDKNQRYLSIKMGYRMLESGADNDEVYTFSMFHFAVFGLEAAL